MAAVNAGVMLQQLALAVENSENKHEMAMALVVMKCENR
jgi:hypothetical protein